MSNSKKKAATWIWLVLMVLMCAGAAYRRAWLNVALYGLAVVFNVGTLRNLDRISRLSRSSGRRAP